MQLSSAFGNRAARRDHSRAQRPFAPGSFPHRGPCAFVHPLAHRHGNMVNADEGSSWDALHAQYEMKRISRQDAYCLDGACTNWAGEFFSMIGPCISRAFETFDAKSILASGAATRGSMTE